MAQQVDDPQRIKNQKRINEEISIIHSFAFYTNTNIMYNINIKKYL